jgi:hypothetical protein
MSNLLVALGNRISTTGHLYANRKTCPLEQVVVPLRHQQVHADDPLNRVDPPCNRIPAATALHGP